MRVSVHPYPPSFQHSGKQQEEATVVIGTASTYTVSVWRVPPVLTSPSINCRDAQSIICSRIRSEQHDSVPAYPAADRENQMHARLIVTTAGHKATGDCLIQHQPLTSKFTDVSGVLTTILSTHCASGYESGSAPGGPYPRSVTGQRLLSTNIALFCAEDKKNVL